MRKLEINLCFVCGIALSLLTNLFGITEVAARTEYHQSKEYESVVELPILTPMANTESIPLNSFDSSEVTSEAAALDIYDQISPSRDPTTPLSRRIFSPRYQESIDIPSSTIPTILNAPPPLYHIS